MLPSTVVASVLHRFTGLQAYIYKHIHHNKLTYLRLSDFGMSVAILDTGRAMGHIAEELNMERNRRIDIAITITMAFTCISLIVWAQVFAEREGWIAPLLERVAYAGVIALAVRWLHIAFEWKNHNKTESKQTDVQIQQPLLDVVPDKDIYASSAAEIRLAIQTAKSRIHILQTWLPGVGGDAGMILRSAAPSKRLILSSFKKCSPIYARIQARCDLMPKPVQAAKRHAAGSALPFVAAGRADDVRFTPAHHAGWAAIIDDYVFWGFTPLTDDNWAIPEVCFKAPSTDNRAKFWEQQFELIWEGVNRCTGERFSHQLNEECEHNHILKVGAAAYRPEKRPNFGVKLPRPGFGPAAELPPSPPA